MKLRAMRRRGKPIKEVSIKPKTRPRGKHVVLQSFIDVGYDDYNTWDEFIVLRFK